MKFSIRQILASAAGAVIAAVIASIFGVKGTIVGVAIGSAAATFGHGVGGAVDRAGPRRPSSRWSCGPPRRRRCCASWAGPAPAAPAVRRRDASRGSDRLHAPGAGSGDGRDGVVGGAGGGDRASGDLGRGRRPGHAAHRRHDPRRCSRPAARAAGQPAAIPMDRHRGHGGHRVRARAAVHHGDRADLGQTAGRDLRRTAARDDGQEHLHAVAARRHRPRRPRRLRRPRRRRRPRVDDQPTSTTTSTTRRRAPPRRSTPGADDHHDRSRRVGQTTTTSSPGQRSP